MLSEIFKTTCIIPINISISVIDANNEAATNVGDFQIDSGKINNKWKRNRKDCILAIRCQRTIKSSAKLFWGNNIDKHIRFTSFWFFYSIFFIFIFVEITSNSISIICTSTSVFIISSNKKLAYGFLSFKSNIRQYSNHINYQQQQFYYLHFH